jgi:hypothetical protein
MPKQNSLLVLLAIFALSGCELFDGQGQVSLFVSGTAAVQEFDEVVVQFSQATFVNDSGDEEVVELDPERVDLLSFTGDDAKALFEDVTVPSGSYRSVKLQIDSDENNQTSYVSYSDGSRAILFVPEDQESKLTLRLDGDIKIEDGETTALAAAFELRKSLRRISNATYELHPAVRLVLNSEVGVVNGSVANGLITGSSCAVYAYSGAGITPDDIDDVGAEPITTGEVTAANDGLFRYEIGPLEGDSSYTLALTCEADLEDPEESETLEFIRTINVDVEADSSVVEDF